MAICDFCGKEMLGASSCLESDMMIDGTVYPPVPFRKDPSGVFREEQQPPRCPECNVRPGGLHHVGCQMEICPRCGGRWVSCRCSGIKWKKNSGLSEKGRIIPFRRSKSGLRRLR